MIGAGSGVVFVKVGWWGRSPPPGSSSSLRKILGPPGARPRSCHLHFNWGTRLRPSPDFCFLTFFVPSQIFTSSSCGSWLLRIKEAFNWQRSAQEARQRHFQVFFVFPSSPIDDKTTFVYLFDLRRPIGGFQTCPQNKTLKRSGYSQTSRHWPIVTCFFSETCIFQLLKGNAPKIEITCWLSSTEV